MEYSIEQAQDKVIQVLIDNDHYVLTFSHLQSLLPQKVLKAAMLKPMIHKLKKDGMVV